MEQSLLNAVKAIKAAILKAQAETLRNANASLLSLYYGIGRYVSRNSREGTWGTGAIDSISRQLQAEMPGLRGFGARNLKNMRTFYEFWSPVLNRQMASADLEGDEAVSLAPIRQLVAAEIDLESFLSIGFVSRWVWRPIAQQMRCPSACARPCRRSMRSRSSWKGSKT